MKSLLSSKTFFPSTSTPSSLTVHLPLAGSLNWIHQNPFQFWHLCLIASILSTDFFSWIMQHLTPGPKICLLFIKLHPCCCWSQTNNWFLSIMFCFWDHLFLAMQNSCSMSNAHSPYCSQWKLNLPPSLHYLLYLRLQLNLSSNIHPWSVSDFFLIGLEFISDLLCFSFQAKYGFL